MELENGQEVFNPETEDQAYAAAEEDLGAQELDDVSDELEDTDAEGAEGIQETEDGLVIDIEGDGDDPEPDDNTAPKWVRDLRRKAKDDKRTIRELQMQLQQYQSQPQLQPQQPPLNVPKPTLESCDYDTDRYEQETAAWIYHQNMAAQQQQQMQARRNAETAAWFRKLDQYDEKKAALRVKDYDVVEEIARQNLSVLQQGIIVNGAENPATVVYALGKSPKRLAELAKIQDPVQFAFAIAKLEAKLKVNRSAGAPKPERRVSGTAGVSGRTLEKLRAEAARTGDYTKVHAFKRKQQMR